MKSFLTLLCCAWLLVMVMQCNQLVHADSNEQDFESDVAIDADIQEELGLQPESEVVDESSQYASKEPIELPKREGKKTIFEEMLGETLYVWGVESNPDGTPKERVVYETYTAELLKGKDVVALYFSASWCGPCKQFTPQLAQFYESMNKKGKKFEIVWISADRTGEEFLGYYEKMPWLAVTMNNVQKVTEKLSPKYQVKGIPHLVILDGDDASVYTLDGRTMVLKDSYGLEFPWRPRTITNLLPKSLRSMIKNKIAEFKSNIRDKVLNVMKGIIPPSLWKIIFPRYA